MEPIPKILERSPGCAVDTNRKHVLVACGKWQQKGSRHWRADPCLHAMRDSPEGPGKGFRGSGSGLQRTGRLGDFRVLEPNPKDMLQKVSQNLF